MSEADGQSQGGLVHYEFVKAHIAATMALVNGLVIQNAIDRDALDGYFTGFLSQLPHSRDTLALRLIIDQWRQGLHTAQPEPNRLNAHLFEVIQGGREAAE
ncbi:hypothetical protein [Breoghania sp.]|uniref:hypothetical protein n=1 Tax=Breoghania sp. TaxID=2065378 RepID=UPI002AAAC3F9|nr:hypothetical protein [Breoghania sp.]